MTQHSVGAGGGKDVWWSRWGLVCPPAEVNQATRIYYFPQNLGFPLTDKERERGRKKEKKGERERWGQRDRE